MSRTPLRWIRAFDAEVGARIRARRLQLGLTHHRLARDLGMSVQELQAYERGDERVPAPTLEKFAKTLSITTLALLPTTKR